jgi:hypothetical protein
MSDSRKELPGRKPGDRRVRIERPHAQYFRYEAPGVYSAKLAAEAPTTPLGQALARTRRILFGRPLSNEEEIVERLPKWKALPVFSSDVMSSVAYATEASLYTLLGVGTLAFGWLLPISFAIVGVLGLVTLGRLGTSLVSRPGADRPDLATKAHNETSRVRRVPRRLHAGGHGPWDTPQPQAVRCRISQSVPPPPRSP